MRPIDADALIEVLKREEKENDEYGLTQRADGITDAIMDVIDAPTIEPQRMRGRWEYLDYGGVGNYHCSACRRICVNKGDYDFCPFCGADMRGTE